MPKWNVTSYSLTGYDAKDYTYTYNQLLYVMEPDEDSVSEAIALINKLLSGDALESSYENIGGSSSKVTKVYIPPVKQNNNTQVKNNNKKEDIEDNKDIDSSETDTTENEEHINSNNQNDDNDNKDNNQDTDDEVPDALLP